MLMEIIFESLWRLVLVSFFISLVASFWIILLSKSGLREYISVHSNRFFHSLLECSFCLSFWFCVVLAIMGYILLPEWSGWVVIPFTSSVISRIFL